MREGDWPTAILPKQLVYLLHTAVLIDCDDKTKETDAGSPIVIPTTHKEKNDSTE